MATLTLDDVDRIAADHHAAEATKHAPKPAAIRAVYTLASLLAELDATDRAAVLALLAEETAELLTTA